jgi:DNA polymerase-1
MNWGSPAQVLTLLQQRDHAITDTNEQTLTPLATVEPLIPLLLRRRDAAVNAAKYDPAAGVWCRHPVSGRLHAQYHQLGSRAGRMSCGRDDEYGDRPRREKNPNIQGVPRGPRYRSGIRAADGSCLVKADYGQIELRLAAVIAPEPVMLEAFQAGADLHRLTASRVFGCDVAAVTSEQRQLAKSLNFGLLYGMGAARLQAQILKDTGQRIQLDEAKEYKRDFFATYRGLAQWQARTNRERAWHGGTLETRTLAGRRRLAVSQYAECLNSPVQGTGADGFKAAMGRLFRHRAEVPDAHLII